MSEQRLRELTLPALPDGYFWDNRIEKHDGHQSVAIRLVGPDQCIVSKARIDLEMYGLAGVLERAQGLADNLRTPSGLDEFASGTTKWTAL